MVFVRPTIAKPIVMGRHKSKSMTNYKCTNSFTSSKGMRFSYGTKVSSSVYQAMPYSEQRNFTMVMDESSSYGSSSSSYDGSSSILSTPSFDFGSSSSDSSSSSTDFGGGDFGGGGASGDW